MIKGGFQGLDISGVDLTAQSPTLPGGYAACQAADGKTVLVLTAAGAVQCSVKKVSTNYVLAGITGDGKILSITIGSTDGIEVIETEIPNGDDPVGIDVNGTALGDTYTSSSPFTVPEDGYVTLLYLSTVEAGSLTNLICKTTAGNNIQLTRVVSSGSAVLVGIFVKKGMKIYASPTNTLADCVYRKLVY